MPFKWMTLILLNIVNQMKQSSKLINFSVQIQLYLCMVLIHTQYDQRTGFCTHTVSAFGGLLVIDRLLA